MRRLHTVGWKVGGFADARHILESVLVLQINFYDANKFSLNVFAIHYEILENLIHKEST